MYTLVPRHVREDLRWMADIGTRLVSLAVLEQDFRAAGENIDLVCEQAHRAGQQVVAVPARWGGLTAGAPKVYPRNIQEPDRTCASSRPT